MKLILDNQIRRADFFYSFDYGCLVFSFFLVVSIAICIRPQKTVSRALLADFTKQGSNSTFPCHHRKFINCGDQHCRGTMIDFVINNHYWQADFIFSTAEFTAPKPISAIDMRLSAFPINNDFPSRLNFSTTPWTGSQLCRSRTYTILVFTFFFNRIVTFLGRVGCCFLSYPQPDRKWSFSPFFWFFTADIFHRTN